jgi:hypothetical protein
MSKSTLRVRGVFLAFVAALTVAVMAAPTAQSSPATATISVSFSADYLSASIESTKGISHYDIVLCDGTAYRRDIPFDTKSYTVGPLDAEILSISVKSATTKHTFLSGFAGECKKTPPKDPDPKG